MLQDFIPPPRCKATSDRTAIDDSSQQLRLLRRPSAVLLSVLLLVAASLDAATQRRTSPFWTSDDDCLTTIHLRNNLIDEPLTVQPILHLEDGTAVPIPAVTLSPRGNESIQVNQLMASLGYAAEQYGGAEFLYERDYGGALNVETEVLMPENNLAYSIESFASNARATNEKHGVFWLPMRTAELFFAVYNSSDQTVTVEPELTYQDVTSNLDPIILPPNGFGKVRMLGPQAREPKDQRVGGITIRHDGPAGAVQATGWIDCDESGYSSMMAFTDPGLLHGNELYGNQIFIGKHAALASLGRGGDVESHLVLKNMSAVDVAADAEVYYQDAGGAGVAPIALGTLGAGEVLAVSFDDLQRRGLIPRSVSEAAVVVRHLGQEGALMGRVFGISANRTFGFYTKLESYVGGGYDAVHWTTEGDRDSIITVTNFGEDADDVTVTLAYNGGSLDLATIPLEPHASATVNVRDYLSSLPAGVVEGGYAVQGKDRRTSKLLTKQHVVSADEGVALPFYGTYVYAVALYMASTSSVTLGIGETDTVDLYLQWSDSTQDECSWCNDFSGNSGIATITTDGYPYWTRVITGVGEGNTYVQADSWEVIDEYGDTGTITSYPQKPVTILVFEITVNSITPSSTSIIGTTELVLEVRVAQTNLEGLQASVQIQEVNNSSNVTFNWVSGHGPIMTKTLAGGSTETVYQFKLSRKTSSPTGSLKFRAKAIACIGGCNSTTKFMPTAGVTTDDSINFN